MTDEQIEWLGVMARQFETNTGRPPKTIKEIADHFYELSDSIVVLEHVDEEGHHHPAETLIEVDDDHMKHCIWLRDLEKHPDASAMLAAACDASFEEVRAYVREDRAHGSA